MPLFEDARTMIDVSDNEALDSLTRSARQAAPGAGLRPVELWHPPYCGEIDMRIAADGTWFYGGTPIKRAPLVKLFASILRKDPERFVLVTPVEMVAITVDDAPFIAVELHRDPSQQGPTLTFRTNVDDEVSADAAHPLRFVRDAKGGLKPYIRVRGDLWARVARPLVHDLVERGETRDIDGDDFFGVVSAGTFFAMAPMAEIEGI
jgi:uncharacterized protein